MSPPLGYIGILQSLSQLITHCPNLSYISIKDKDFVHIKALLEDGMQMDQSKELKLSFGFNKSRSNEMTDNEIVLKFIGFL